MKRKTRLREDIAFVLFLAAMSAMDSDNRVAAVIMILATLWQFYCMGQAYRKEEYEEQSIVAYDGHSDGVTGRI